MGRNLTEELRSWARQFACGDLSVEDVQDRFAAISDIEIAGLSTDVRHFVATARQELDAIRFGMCQAGQAAEINRIFMQMDLLLNGRE